MHSEKSVPKRILIIKLSSIGDVVMATPVAKALRNEYPDAYIAWAVEDKSKDVLNDNPYLDEVIVINRKWSSKGGILEVFGTLSGIFSIYPKIKALKFDLVIDLQGLMRSALVGIISKAAIRLGFDNAGEHASLFYTRRLKTNGKKIRGPLDYLNMLKLLGIQSNDVDMLVPFTGNDTQYADELINEFTGGYKSLPIAALCPSTTWPQKHWTEYGWAKLADSLALDYGILPIFMGSASDIALIERIQSMMSARSAVAAGKTTLNQASALLSKCSYVVAVDTGLLHIAVGLNKPTVGIFGPTSWLHLAEKPSFRVVSKECKFHPCLRHPKCKRYDCMEALVAGDIIDKMADWLPSRISESESIDAHLVNIRSHRPLNTVHIETGMHSLGGPAQVIYLLKGLKDRGYKATLICPKNSGIYEKAVSSDLDVYPISLISDLDISFIWKIVSFLKKSKPDIVHLHSRRGADLMGGIAARLSNIPGVILSRRIDNPIRRGLLSSVKYCRLCDKIIAISSGIRDVMLKSGIEPDKVVCVRSSVNAAAYQADKKLELRNELGIPEGNIVIGVIAQLIERKGHKYLFDAMPEVLARYANTSVLILGEGHLKSKLEEYVKTIGINDNVIFAGFRDDIPHILREIDILVHPAMMEGLGVSILQAMSAGIPVIASAVGGIPEAVRDNVNGFLVPPEDPNAIKVALFKLLSDPDFRAQMGGAGKTIVENEFSVDVMVNGAIEVYDSVLKQKSPLKD